MGSVSKQNEQLTVIYFTNQAFNLPGIDSTIKGLRVIKRPAISHVL